MWRELLPNVLGEEIARWRHANCAVKPDVCARQLWQSMLAPKLHQ
jgi:hypothetical protein